MSPLRRAARMMLALLRGEPTIEPVARPALSDEARAFLDFATDPDAQDWGPDQIETIEEFFGVR